VDLGQTGILNVKTNNAAAYINAQNNMALGTVDVGSAGVQLTASNGSILNGSGANSVATANLIAGADSTLTSLGQATSTIGLANTALWVNVNGGSLTVSASGVNQGVSVNINGIVFPGNGLTKNGNFGGAILFNNINLNSKTLQSQQQSSEIPFLYNCHEDGKTHQASHNCSVFAQPEAPTDMSMPTENITSIPHQTLPTSMTQNLFKQESSDNLLAPVPTSSTEDPIVLLSRQSHN
jgi:hypothetical protein